MVHLSHRIDPAMPRWPGDPEVTVARAALLDRDGYNLNVVTMGEHAGTHVNAPLSFFDDARGIDDIPAAALIAPSVVIDVRANAAADPDYAVTLDDLSAWEERHGAVPRGALALLHTGWCARWTEPQAFLGRTADGALHFPGFGIEAAARLLDERHVGGLGSDTAGVDRGLDATFAVNRATLARGALVLENLANLGALPATGATLFVGALRFRGGSGSPAAVLALVP